MPRYCLTIWDRSDERPGSEGGMEVGLLAVDERDIPTVGQPLPESYCAGGDDQVLMVFGESTPPAGMATAMTTLDVAAEMLSHLKGNPIEGPYMTTLNDILTIGFQAGFTYAEKKNLAKA